MANVAGISHNMPHIAKKILHVCRANFNIHFAAPTAAKVKKKLCVMIKVYLDT